MPATAAKLPKEWTFFVWLFLLFLCAQALSFCGVIGAMWDRNALYGPPSNLTGRKEFQLKLCRFSDRAEVIYPVRY